MNESPPEQVAEYASEENRAQEGVSARPLAGDGFQE
jgi:hypothetical protein